MASPTFVHRYRPLSNKELGRLNTHLLSSGTTYEALAKFNERVDQSWPEGPWVIPLPGDSNLFYIIGTPPEGFEPIPEQLELCTSPTFCDGEEECWACNYNGGEDVEDR